MISPLRLLLVEDSLDDSELLLRELRRGGCRPECLRVDTEEQMLQALRERNWDLVISDYVIPGFGGMEALKLFETSGLDIPFIVISGHIGEEIAVAALKAGADDYIMKDRLARLVPAIERALDEAAIRRAHRKAGEQLAINARELQAAVTKLEATSEELRKSNSELLRAREELEQRVEERTADLRAVNFALQRHITERRRLENELLEIVEVERHRIGFDAHDDIGQRLMGVSLLVKALETSLEHGQTPAAGAARAVSGLLDEVINHSNTLADCFTSVHPSGGNLAEEIRKLIASVRSRFNITCRLRVSGEVPELSPETTLQLCKIAQEALSHSIKHGKATQVLVYLANRRRDFVLQIGNDGVPYQVSEDPGDQLGMRIMSYRAKTIGASLEMAANGDSGTLVTCALPLGPEPARDTRPAGFDQPSRTPGLDRAGLVTTA